MPWFWDSLDSGFQGRDMSGANEREPMSIYQYVIRSREAGNAHAVVLGFAGASA